jgi:thioredoxin-dependent peroxiredoxin
MKPSNPSIFAGLLPIDDSVLEDKRSGVLNDLAPAGLRRTKASGIVGAIFQQGSGAMALKVGDKAPAFSMKTDGAGKVSLSQLKGQNVVLYFYPKDDTSGCTAEACGFRDSLPKFGKIDAAVVGVSRDSVESHDKFKKKHKLNFTLGSDETGKVTEDYGVWVEKSMYGRKYMGIERATFLIDGKGVIRGIWRKVKVPGHVDEVLKEVKKLSAEPAAA